MVTRKPILRLSKVIGFCTPDQVIDVAEKTLRFSVIMEIVRYVNMLVLSTQLMIVELSGLSKS